MPLTIPVDAKRRRVLDLRKRVLQDLRKKGLVAYVWVIDSETGESTRKWTVTNKAHEILNGIGRRE